MAKPVCLICGNPFDMDEEDQRHNTFAGGDVVISFGYGSIHDQLGFGSLGDEYLAKHMSETEAKMARMLKTDKIYARMCDDCWTKVWERCEGINVTTETKEERVV